MTKHIRRIQFYTRKAAAYATDRRPRNQRNKYRFDRLMRYKAAMHRRIEADGYRWRPAIALDGR
ncbi:MAG: hypothetical protein BAA01_11760 [Bacillus thermozeamaize]|uniref:Uncharacterized protein n=1 Tax=Bacillus thermozeamaize TaxID=230954 RepID=A0A1Y3PH58_9BACI|nr:MAG: hypothetical protein BAA01_11760 [Bacillus thermozeamaize]